MTRENVHNRSWILKVIRDRCELTRAETDYLNDLIEVIEQIPDLKEAYNKGYKDGQKALAVHLELCKEEQEPCKDCISREDAEMCLTADITNMTIEEYISMVGDRLKGLPSIQPTAKENLVVGDCISREQLVRELNAQMAVGAITKEVAIDMLEHLPPITPQPEKRTEERTETHACDCISRQAVLKQLKGCLTGGETEYNYVKLHIDSIPPVTPKPKTGQWIYDKKTDLATCSKCSAYCPHDKLGRIETNFCPNCGAKMSEIPTGSESEEV